MFPSKTQLDKWPSQKNTLESRGALEGGHFELFLSMITRERAARERILQMVSYRLGHIDLRLLLGTYHLMINFQTIYRCDYYFNKINKT